MHSDRAEIRAVALASVMLTVGLLAGCGPSHVRVPDTAPQMQPPPESAMRPCPTAESEATGKGVLPDLPPEKPATRGDVLRVLVDVAEDYGKCAARVETLQEAIEDQLKSQREHAMSRQ